MCIYIYIFICVYICVYKCIKYANYIPIYYQHIPIIYPSYYTTYAGETAYQLQLHSSSHLWWLNQLNPYLSSCCFSHRIISNQPVQRNRQVCTTSSMRAMMLSGTILTYATNIYLKKNITVGGFPTKIARCSHDFNFHDHSKPLLASWRLSGIASRRNLIHRHMGNAHGWK